MVIGQLCEWAVGLTSNRRPRVRNRRRSWISEADSVWEGVAGEGLEPPTLVLFFRDQSPDEPPGFTLSEPSYENFYSTRPARRTRRHRISRYVNERQRQAAIPLRDMRYFAARVRTAQVITNPTSTDTVAFGSTVTFRPDDGRVQKYRIVGEDEADPKAGSISFVSPVARLLIGNAVGDEVGASGQNLEIISIS